MKRRQALTPRQLEIHKRNTTFNRGRRIESHMFNLQPPRVSEVLYVSRSNQREGGERTNPLMEHLKNKFHELDYRTRSRKCLLTTPIKQSILPYSSRTLFRTPRLSTDALGEDGRKSVDLIKSTILTGSKARIFDFNKLTSLFSRKNASMSKMPSVLTLLNRRRHSESTNIHPRISLG
jgi:hypothetical protein